MGIVTFYLYTVVGIFMITIYMYLINNNIGTSLTRGAIFFGYLVPATITYYWVMLKKSNVNAKKK